MKHKALAAFIGLAVVVNSETAFAEKIPESNKDLNLGVGLGWGHVFGEHAENPDGGRMMLTWRGLNYTPLELYGEIGPGAMAGLNLHVVSFNRLSLHLLDLGVSAPWEDNKFPVRSDVKRSFDLTLGGGLDVFIWDSIMVSVGVRWNVPNPVEVVSDALDGKYDSRAAEASQTVPAAGTDNAKLREKAKAQSVLYDERSEFLRRVYRDSFNSPQLNIDLRFYFDTF